MDYELVENPEIHLKKQQIITLRNANGLGLPRLIWCTEGLIQGAASVIFSVSLLSTAFTLSYSTDPGGWSFLYSPWSILLIIALIALNIMLNTFITKKSIKKFMAFSSEFVPLSRLSEYYFQSLSQYNAGKDMRIYALNQISLKEFQNAFLGINKTMGKLCKFQARYDSAVAVSSTVLSGLIYAFVALKALFGSFAVGNIVQYVGSLSKLGSGVTSLMNNLALLNANADTLRLFYEFTDMPSVKYQGTLPVEKRNDNEYELEFHNVSFRYPGSDAYALKNLSLKLRVGQRMAVVGMNGSGKTTMIKLLCRL
ncbi:MAG: ATP-binding cassette domain-containing protein [Hydrogeniiclostridium mannosilyticum]